MTTRIVEQDVAEPSLTKPRGIGRQSLESLQAGLTPHDHIACQDGGRSSMNELTQETTLALGVQVSEGQLQDGALGRVLSHGLHELGVRDGGEASRPEAARLSHVLRHVDAGDDEDRRDSMTRQGLPELAHGEGYEKAPFEDLQSIAQGIQGQKGFVHLNFGIPLTRASLSVLDAVSAIDNAMAANYRLFKTNFWACEALGHVIDESDRDAAEASITQSAFLARFDDLSEAERQRALEMYARPVLNAMASKDRV